MKITFLMITFNTDFVLEQVIQSILPFAYKVIVVEGPVAYWRKKGYTTSTDDTNEILAKFGNQIKVIHGQWEEKVEMCRAGFDHVPHDTDYLWCIDSDEVFKPEDIITTQAVLQSRQPSTVGFQSNTFFGGFNRIIGGFEQRHSFKRILKYSSVCKYRTHRPPTLIPEADGEHIKGKEMFEKYGVSMYHYSYVSPRQVAEKVEYYENAVIRKGDCIKDYFKQLWLPWVGAHQAGSEQTLNRIEQLSAGVHEFQPSVRGDAFTKIFTGLHPKVILDTHMSLQDKFDSQLKEYVK